jgi:hypothetical protein
MKLATSSVTFELNPRWLVNLFSKGMMMTKTYNREDFLAYVKELNFVDLEDAASFVNEYYKHYISLSNEDNDEKQLAWEKYMILLSKFGHWFVNFSLMVFEMQKNLELNLKDNSTKIN